MPALPAPVIHYPERRAGRRTLATAVVALGLMVLGAAAETLLHN
jgi:hypothetical protein